MDSCQIFSHLSLIPESTRIWASRQSAFGADDQQTRDSKRAKTHIHLQNELVMASMQGNLDEVKRLISKEASPTMKCSGDCDYFLNCCGFIEKQAPLSVAISYGHQEVVNYFIQVITGIMEGTGKSSC